VSFFKKKSFAETNSRVVHLSGSQCKFLPLRKPEMLTLESIFPTVKRKAHASRLQVNGDDQKSVRVKPSPFLSQIPLVPRPLEFSDRPHDREPGTDYK